jgi:hypothetical protein
VEVVVEGHARILGKIPADSHETLIRRLRAHRLGESRVINR